jgi:hypothetical protein
MKTLVSHSTSSPSNRFTTAASGARVDSMPVFSIGQIAATVGMSRVAVRAALRGIEPAAQILRSGNVAPGYAVEVLPERIKAKIEEIRSNLNYRSPQALLAAPRPQWQPAKPMSEQPPAAVEYAHCLKQALAFYIAHRNDMTIRAGDLLSRARRDWQDAFKKPVNIRHIRRAVDRVLKRDGGREEFSRLEIYLPEVCKSERPAATDAAEFPRLEEKLEFVADVSALTVDERTVIWHGAVDDLESLIAQGTKNAKRRIVDFLFVRVPRLAETREALRRQLDRKWNAHLADGIAALADKRRLRSGAPRFQHYRGPESLSPDEWLLLERANSVGGGISQAFRELYVGTEIAAGQHLQFSEEFRAAYSFNPRSSKSRVPNRLRNKLRPLLKAIEPHNHGPKAARLAAPSIHRDWSGVASGAWFQSDDETSNNYVWFPCEDGAFEFEDVRFNVLRPQILPMVDVRTDYVLSVLLILRRQYDSRDIRSLILQTCLDERVGLPFEGFYFEGNIWQANNIHALVNWADIDSAFSRGGLELRLRHARTPRAKIIERIFSQEQNMTQALPGYAGRNEMTAGYERVKASLALMKRVGQPLKVEAAPWDHFLSAEQYLDELQRIYERFNQEPQNGKRLPGMSPAEGWEKFSGGRAHHVIPDSLRYLLATEQSEQRVTREGVRIPGKPSARYFLSDRLGEFIGDRVIVRWNQDFPDHVVVVHPASDPLAQDPFVVRENAPNPACDPTREDSAITREARKAFTRTGRTLFRMLKHGYGRTVRDNLLGTAPLRMAGEAHEAAVQSHRRESGLRTVAEREVLQIAGRAGFDASRIRNFPRAAEELRVIEDLEARLLAEEETT